MESLEVAKLRLLYWPFEHPAAQLAAAQFATCRKSAVRKYRFDADQAKILLKVLSWPGQEPVTFIWPSARPYMITGWSAVYCIKQYRDSGLRASFEDGLTQQPAVAKSDATKLAVPDRAIDYAVRLVHMGTLEM